MRSNSKLRVIDADQVAGGVIVTFGDGRIAIFPADLLYSLISSAREVFDTEEENGDVEIL
jgi:hypothetical protein